MVGNVVNEEQRQSGTLANETQVVYPRPVTSDDFGYEAMVGQSLEKILQYAERDEGITAFI
eukprot:3211069-Karenia_brevis.AAC.1